MSLENLSLGGVIETESWKAEEVVGNHDSPRLEGRWRIKDESIHT